MTEEQPQITKFLLVDDREENLVALASLLERDGLAILEARSGTEALELLLVHDVALAIIDVQMPEIDGFMLAELMRGAKRSRHIPIIFVTAGVHEPQRIFQGYDAGAVDFLFKPIDPQILRHKTNTFFALHQQQQALRETLRLNELFVAAVGHDLRNPLNAMLLAVQSIELVTSDPEVQTLARRARENGKRMTRMIDDLFDLARARLGSGLPVTRAPTELSGLVERSCARMSALHPSRSLHFDASTSPLVGTWDEGRLEQLVDNLLDNAIKHGSPSHPIDVTLHVEDVVAHLAVHNEGAIAPELLPHLFDPFRTHREPRERTVEGLGLGLYIVRRIASAHGGKVEVRSSEADGTTFRVHLPI